MTRMNAKPKQEIWPFGDTTTIEFEDVKFNEALIQSWFFPVDEQSKGTEDTNESFHQKD